jgi:putative transposase
MVADAVDYPWSSYGARISERPNDHWLDIDPCFTALGDTVMARRHQYERFMQQATSDEETRLIRDALQRGQLTGASRFVDEVERIVGQRIEQRGRGRPRSGSGK